MASVTRKLDLLETKVRGQADEIDQIKLKVHLHETQLNKANIQIQYLLQASRNTDDDQSGQNSSLNVTTIIEEIDQKIQRLESEVF